MFRNPQRFRSALIMAFALTASIAAAVVSISAESLWIDEYITYDIANRPGFGSWLAELLSRTSSDIQKPFYHLYLFAWSQAFGLSEYSMRMANAPWLVAGAAVTAWAFRRTPMLAFCMLFALVFHPLIWFYLNDAQIYPMFYGSTMIACAGLYGFYLGNEGRASRAETRVSLLLLCAGIFLAGGSTMLGIAWGGVLAVLAAYAWWRGSSRHALEGPDIGILAVFVVLMTALGVHYFFTLLQGASASQLNETNLLTLGFSLYEVLGIGGLGPGRDDLRNFGAGKLLEYWPSVLAGGIVIVAFLARSGERLWRDLGRRRMLVLLGALLLPVLFTAIVGYATSWRVLGRHFMPAAVIVAYLAGFGLWRAVLQGRPAGRAVALVFAIVYAGSALSYTAARHAKEDYILASAQAAEHAQDGHLVWWTAFPPLAEHYGLPLTAIRRNESCTVLPAPGSALLTLNLGSSCLQSLAAPDVIFLARPGAHDQQGATRDYVSRKPYEAVDSPAGFQVWRRIVPPHAQSAD
jgi:hypothetical protein